MNLNNINDAYFNEDREYQTTQFRRDPQYLQNPNDPRAIVDEFYDLVWNRDPNVSMAAYRLLVEMDPSKEYSETDSKFFGTRFHVAIGTLELPKCPNHATTMSFLCQFNSNLFPLEMQHLIEYSREYDLFQIWFCKEGMMSENPSRWCLKSKVIFDVCQMKSLMELASAVAIKHCKSEHLDEWDMMLINRPFQQVITRDCIGIIDKINQVQSGLPPEQVIKDLVRIRELPEYKTLLNMELFEDIREMAMYKLFVDLANDPCAMFREHRPGTPFALSLPESILKMGGYSGMDMERDYPRCRNCHRKMTINCIQIVHEPGNFEFTLNHQVPRNFVQLVTCATCSRPVPVWTQWKVRSMDF